MQTVGEFLTECGRRLAPFDRLRVGRVGCGVAIAAIAVAIVLLAAGLKETGGSWAAGFRFVILTALGCVILLFAGYAAVEGFVDRDVRRRVQEYLRASGNDLETLTRAAEIRSGAIPGGRRLLALLKERARG